MKKPTIFCIALCVQAVLLAVLFVCPSLGADAVKWEFLPDAPDNRVLKAVSVRGCDETAVQQVNNDLQAYMAKKEAQYPGCAVWWTARVSDSNRDLSVVTLDAAVLNLMEGEDNQKKTEWMQKNANLPLEDKFSVEVWVYVQDGEVKTVLKELPDTALFSALETDEAEN